MVRNYKRKTNRRNWSEENLKAAIRSVHNGNSCNAAAIAFDIPEPTLRRYVKKTEPEYAVHAGRFRETFSTEQLEVLRTYIIDIDKRAFGLTRTQCRRLVYDFAEENGIPHRFNRQLKMAGKDWLFNFMKKNKLSLRKPEATSIGRLMAFNKVNVAAFFSTLREIRQRTPYEPHQIFNVDETGISTVPTKLPQTISPTGARRVSKIVSGERGKNVTAVCCMSATGKYIPPFIIFPRKRMKPELIQGTPVGTVGFCSDSGWMTADLFYSYMQHFAKYALPSAVNPILLLLDNHASHINLKVINFCRGNHITLLGFPAHTSHRMQPLDVALYGPLKTYFSQFADDFMVSNPGQVIAEKDLGRIFGKAYAKAATYENAVKGFEACGIEPFNSQCFSDADFAASSTTDRELESIEPPKELPKERQLNQAVQPVEMISENSQEVDQNVQDRPNDGSKTPTKTINQNNNDTQNNFNNNNEPVASCSFTIEPEERRTKLVRIASLPVAIRKENRRKRQKAPSMVITSTPVKDYLEEKDAKKIAAQKKKEDAKRKREAKKKENTKEQKLKKVKRNVFDSKRGKSSESSDSSLSEPNYVSTDNEDSSEEENQDTLCLYCSQQYSTDTSGEPWIRCIRCLEWAHQTCWREKDWKKFLCDNCL